MSISTVHGILSTLRAYNFIAQDPEIDKYFLGFALLHLGTKISDGLELHRITMPHIEALSEIYGDTVHIAILSQDEAVYVDKVEGKRPTA